MFLWPLPRFPPVLHPDGACWDAMLGQQVALMTFLLFLLMTQERGQKLLWPVRHSGVKAI